MNPRRLLKSKPDKSAIKIYMDQSFLLVNIDIKVLNKILANLIHLCIKLQFCYRNARRV